MTAVHGGGAQATQLAERLGMETRLVNGRRVTDDDTLEIVKMVFAGKISVEILVGPARARRARASASRASTATSCSPAAARRSAMINRETGKREVVDFGNVGDVVDVDPRLADDPARRRVPAGRRPSAADEEGKVFNVNADAIASAIAIELSAEKLILLSDVPGVLRSRATRRASASRLTAAEARRLARSPRSPAAWSPSSREISRVAEAGRARGPHRQRQPEKRPPLGDLRRPRQRHRWWSARDRQR